MTHDVDAAIAAVQREFAVLLQSAATSLRERAARVHPHLAPLGYRVLALLVREGPARASQISERLTIDKSQLSRAVKQLEELELVTGEVDPTDARATVLTPTPAAVEQIQHITEIDRRDMYERLRGWDQADVQELARLFTQLNETFARR